MSDLERVLAKAKYSALPLPRGNSSPTTVFAFRDGQLYIVRNPHTCLPDPPLKITVDPSADTIQFERSFKLDFSGVISFMLKVFSLGNAKSEIEAHAISSATVQMGGLSHHTIETGELIDYLLKQAASTCMRDVLDKEHFTIVAALQATSFTYTFKNSRGSSVKLSLPEAQGMFKADTTLSVQVTNEGSVVVNSPRYVGVISWDGKTISKEIEKARKFVGRMTMRRYSPQLPLALAVEPAELKKRWKASFKAKAVGSGR